MGNCIMSVAFGLSVLSAVCWLLNICIDLHKFVDLFKKKTETEKDFYWSASINKHEREKIVVVGRYAAYIYMYNILYLYVYMRIYLTIELIS